MKWWINITSYVIALPLPVLIKFLAIDDWFDHFVFLWWGLGLERTVNMYFGWRRGELTQNIHFIRACGSKMTRLTCNKVSKIY